MTAENSNANISNYANLSATEVVAQLEKKDDRISVLENQQNVTH